VTSIPYLKKKRIYLTAGAVSVETNYLLEQLSFLPISRNVEPNH